MVSSSEFIRGYTEMIILSMLIKDDDYIYNISNTIAMVSGGMLNITNPSLVIALKKLMDEGKVAAYNKPNERNVNRKYYTITKYGKEYYEKNKNDYLATLDKIRILLGGGFDD